MNADGYVSTGEGILGHNMFAYCGNNPAVYMDPTGCRRVPTLEQALKAAQAAERLKANGVPAPTYVGSSNAINTISDLFEAGATVVHQSFKKEFSLPIWSPVIVTTGTRTTTKISSVGDSTKPFSAYAIQRTDNALLSSAGLKINTLGATANFSLGLDNIGISGSAIINNTLCTFGQRTDFSQMQIGYEFSYAVSWDKYTTTVEYINISVNMWYLLPLILPEALPFTVGPMLKSAFA